MQRRVTATHLLVLVAITATVFFTNLGSARLWDRDEPRNAGCALEMMQRGNLVVPVFNDELRPQKPALLYWLIVSAYQVFGVGEFAARFWSAVLAIGSVLATYGIGRRLLNPSAAFYGALVLATSMMFVVAGRAATPDSVLIFFSTLAMYFYVLGTFAPKTGPADAPILRWPGYYFPQKTVFVIAMYAMLGMAVLAKGPVGFLLPCAIIGMFMLIQRLPAQNNDTWNSRGWLARLSIAVLRPFHPRHFLQTLWRMRPFTLAAVVLAVAAPWYVLVGLQTGWEWPRQFLLTENLSRATSTFENHRGGILYYPLAVLAGFFPWSVFFGPMLTGVDRQLTRKHHWSPAYTFLLCWVGVQIGLFSLAQTKLPSYITPCYPALALLTGAFLSQLAARQTSTQPAFNRLSLLTMIVSGLLISAGLAVTSSVYLAGDGRIALPGLIPVLGGGVALWFYVREKNRQAVTACCASAVVFATCLFGLGTSLVDQHQHSNRILEHVRDRDSALASFGCLESSWIFYSGQTIYELTAESRNGSWADTRERDWAKKDWPSPEQFVSANPDAFIITTEAKMPLLQPRLPGHYQIIATAPYFLRDKNLVLLGPGPTERVASAAEDRSR